MYIANQHWKPKRDVTAHTIHETATLREAVGALARADAKTLFVVNSTGRVIGAYSRGDILRQLTAGPGEDETIRCNRDFVCLYESQLAGRALGHRSLGQVNTLPVLDSERRLVRVLEKIDQPALYIADRVFRPRERPLFIAEIGNNHNGDPSQARALVEAAVAAGADAVKFQARDLSATYVDTSEQFLQRTDFATAYTVRELKRYNLSFDQLAGLMDFTRELGALTICTPFDVTAFDWLLAYGPDAVKIASGDFLNVGYRPLLARSNLPVLMSTGMSTLADIEDVADWATGAYVDAVLLHTNSTYPTAFEDVNLGFLEELRRLSPSGLVGYSGHERGFHVPLVGVALGCVAVEKHFTFDRDLPGNDHKVSLLPAEFARMVKQSQEILSAMGGGETAGREISQGEKLNAISLSKGVYLTRDRRAGDTVAEADVGFASPCIGLSPLEFTRLRSRRLRRDRPAGTALAMGDFDERDERPAAEGPAMGRFGLPVRMRDLRTIWERFHPSFVEYHLFSTDLEIDPAAHVADLAGVALTFHAPEQFDDGFIIDLVSEDEATRTRSRHEIERCIDWCRRAVAATGRQQDITLIINVGGATRHATDLKEFDKKTALARVATLVAEQAAQGVTLLPQTMPPHPWHFGGQAYHRLFVELEDLRAIQALGPVRFCLDLSHTFLALSHQGREFETALADILPLVGYYHIADARFPNGEGLQIGEGDIPLRRFMLQSGLLEGHIPWIPEIWNGHMDDCEGFRTALARLAEMVP